MFASSPRVGALATRLRRIRWLAVLLVVVMGLSSCDRPRDTATPTAPQVLDAPLPVMLGQAPGWDLDEEWAELARGALPGFAGIHRGESGEYVVSITQTEQAEAARDWARASLEAAGKVGAVSARQVTYGFDQLKPWKDALATLLNDETVFWVDIDEVRNQVVLGAISQGMEAELLGQAEALGVPRAAVLVVEARKPEPRQGLQNRTRPTLGGLRIEWYNTSTMEMESCTLGFNAYRGEVRGFVTNSHCSNSNPGLDNTVQYQVLEGYSSHRVGTEHTDPSSNRKSDASFFSYDSGVDSTKYGHIAKTIHAAVNQDGPLTIDSTSPGFRITGKASNSVQLYGELVNKVGQISGWTQGQITQTCVTLQGFPCQWVALVWSRRGDSGAAIFQQNGSSGQQAEEVTLWGILHAGPPGDHSTTWYSPISGVEQDLGTLTVSCSPAPDACDPPLFGSVSGPGYISSDGQYTWTASASGGNGSYSYVWEHRIYHLTSTCTYQTDWYEVGTGDTLQLTVRIPDYDFQVRAKITSGSQTIYKYKTVTLSQHKACPN